MIPVTQTKVVVRNSAGDMVVRGNCMAAVIASILEMPITDVPNIETLFDVTPSLWQEVLMAWTNSLGYDWGNDDRFRVFHDKDFGGENRNKLIEQLSDTYYIVSGKSSRGVYHVCIYQNGNLVHDPHPSREGLTTEEYFESVLPKS